jgi:hypothetical protein
MEKEYLKKYYQEHKEEIKNRSMLRYKLYKHKLLKQMKEYTKLNKDKIKIYKQIYFQINKKRLQLINKSWKLVNRQKLNKLVRIYNKKRRQSDINFKIRHYLSTRLYQGLKGFNKSKKTMDLLGCSIDKLKKHLEKQFMDGMSWSNYGKWHVDHIKPCASFNLSKPSEQRKCFHYINLQPLWAKDNLVKGDR